MADSTETCLSRRRARAAAFLLAASLALPARVLAADGTVRIYESALNAFAAAIQPLTITRSISGTVVVWVPNPFLFGVPTPVPVPYRCNANGVVTGLSFDITPASASVRGTFTGSVCGVGYSSPLFSPVTITVDSVRRLLIRPVSPMTVAPTVTFMGLNIPGPFSVNVAPSLSAVSIPLDTVPFELETPNGPRTIALFARSHQLSLHDGYIEITADAFFR